MEAAAQDLGLFANQVATVARSISRYVPQFPQTTIRTE